MVRLSSEIARLPAYDQMQGWQREVLGSLPQMLAIIGHFRRWRDDSYLADVAELTGQACSGVTDADQLLQGFIAKAGPQENAALVRILHRKLL